MQQSLGEVSFHCPARNGRKIAQTRVSSIFRVVIVPRAANFRAPTVANLSQMEFLGTTAANKQYWPKKSGHVKLPNGREIHPLGNLRAVDFKLPNGYDLDWLGNLIVFCQEALCLLDEVMS